MKLSIQVASTSQTVNVFIQDSSSTTGAGLTGLVYNTGSLTAYYALPRAAAVAITLATQTVTGAWSSGGFVEISSANMPGWYRLDIPDAALASGRFVSVHLKGASNMAPLPLEIELTGWNNQDAVRGGLSALPNAAAEAAGGLYTRGTGAGQINQPANGQIDANTVKISGTVQTARDLGASVLLSSGTGTGQLDFTSGVVKSNTTQLAGQTVTAAAGVTFPTSVASPTNITAGTITTVTTVTNDVGITQAGADKVFGSSGAAIAELAQGIPTATPSPGAALMALYMTLRNKLTTNASTKSVFNDAGTCIFKKALSDDGTTYTEAEAVSGP